MFWENHRSFKFNLLMIWWNSSEKSKLVGAHSPNYL
jgi:hypothetical protein